MATKKRKIPEIPSGAMADIAFLLLIFFLVTTTIEADKGIRRKLPPIPEDEEVITVKANMRNVLFVKVNRNDQILAGGEVTPIEELKDLCIAFVDNANRSKSLKWSISPQEAIVSLQNDVGTSYNMYIQVQNEVAAAYRELRESFAQRRFGKPIGELNAKQAKVVKKEYPLRVSEAEPNVSKGE